MVIGGGNSAAEESLFLTRFAAKITILVREDSMSASALVVAKVLEHPEIEVRFNARVIRHPHDAVAAISFSFSFSFSISCCRFRALVLLSPSCTNRRMASCAASTFPRR